MSLYMVQFDSVQRYVEAATMNDAIVVWRRGMLAENVNAAHNGGWEGNEDPEQVALVNEEPVIRALPLNQVQREALQYAIDYIRPTHHIDADSETVQRADVATVLANMLVKP